MARSGRGPISGQTRVLPVVRREPVMLGFCRDRQMALEASNPESPSEQS